MSLLLDTHIVLWIAVGSDRLPKSLLHRLIEGKDRIYFSAVNIWEIAVKSGLERSDFQIDPSELHQGLIRNGYSELAITSAHALSVVQLPPIHKDPFDRLLIAQAISEGLTLLTADRTIARYPGPIQLI